MLKKILFVFAFLIVGFLAYAATRPDTFHVERSLVINAPAETVFAQLDDIKAMNKWSPWDKMDPQMKKTYSGPDRGVGASYLWEGNKDVGKGRMTITESTPPSSVTSKLEFMAPFEGEAVSGFKLAPEGAGTRVTWSIDGKNNFIAKVISVFMNCDKMMGEQFEKGLASLKSVAEAQKPQEPAPVPTPDI